MAAKGYPPGYVGLTRPPGSRLIFARMEGGSAYYVPAAEVLEKWPSLELAAAISAIMSRIPDEEGLAEEAARVNRSICPSGAFESLKSWLETYEPEIFSVLFPASIPYVLIMNSIDWFPEAAYSGTHEAVDAVVDTITSAKRGYDVAWGNTSTSDKATVLGFGLGTVLLIGLGVFLLWKR